MENNEIMNDMDVIENDEQAVEIIELEPSEKTTHPVVVVAAGIGAAVVAKGIYKRVLKPIGRKIKGLFKKDKSEVIDDVEYVEVDDTQEETEE